MKHAGNSAARPRLALIVTAPITIRCFCYPLIDAFVAAGLDVAVICSDAPDIPGRLPAGARFMPINFSRVISPLADLGALWRLFRVLRRERCDIVQYATPKAGLLGSLAAFLARVPVRVYALWGLYYESRGGLSRVVWKCIDRLICALSTDVVPNAREMLATIVKDRITRPAKCRVLANGSACGVDLSLYDPQRWAAERAAVRARLGAGAEHVVIGIFGRLTGDKGVNEAVAAFVRLAQSHTQVLLLVVGSVEAKDQPRPDTLTLLQSHPQIRRLEWQESLLPSFAAIDIYCLPSYREGLPQSVLEAQAMALPVVCTDISGCREAIADGETGFCVLPRSTDALLPPLEKLVTDAELRRAMGARGRARVARLFDERAVARATAEHKLELLARRGRRGA